MTRTTIDFGIDLGTTNSAIALLKGTDVEVFRNDEGFEYVPSAVWLDKRNNLVVGRAAKERLDLDRENAFSEFKLQMGTEHDYGFARNGRSMKPEELSAEVLKSLKETARKRTGEDLQAAVITVPAAFELPACEATKRAAEYAGFTTSPLLQEPVAAALSYSFQSESDKAFWLVFDLGGGTFDAAIIQVRDGAIEVVNHGGDNHLGGKLIDWAIVEELLIPAVVAAHPVTDFRRGNPKWAGAIAKLKLAAETAKVRLSHADSAEIMIDYLCPDDRGDAVELEFDLKRGDLERLAEPFIRRSINIARRVLEEKRLDSRHIDKVLLVGGPTQMPFLRESLMDPRSGLGIPLEYSVDPMTVVARGAAIFAGTQRLEVAPPPSLSAGQFALDLMYDPVGADQDPPIGGIVGAPEGINLAGYTIEFLNEAAPTKWQSGKVVLAPDGSFYTSLWAEPGQSNSYRIELRGPTGNLQKTIPETLTYTVGVTIREPPLIHSVGVAMADNTTAFFFEKGTPLPARKREVQETAFDLRRDHLGDCLWIPVVEGENQHRADRNTRIGHLEISSKDLKRDIPAGSEIEITIEVDASRIIRAKAYIPILDEEYEEVLKLKKPVPDPETLSQELKTELERLATTREKARQIEEPGIADPLQRIDEEGMVKEVEQALDAIEMDPEAPERCQKRLLDLKIAIDDAEDGLEWPALLAEAEDCINRLHEITAEYGEPAEQQQAMALERETRAAMASRRDANSLRRKIKEMDTLQFSVLHRQPGYWVGFLENLKTMRGSMSDPAQAGSLISQGEQAVLHNDLDGLQDAVRGLIDLLPATAQQQIGHGGGTLKKG